MVKAQRKKDKIEFKNHSSCSEIKMPSKDYLKLHASCARIAHLSGAADIIEKWDRERDESDVLASDGSQSNLLENALMALQQDVPHFISAST